MLQLYCISRIKLENTPTSQPRLGFWPEINFSIFSDAVMTDHAAQQNLPTLISNNHMVCERTFRDMKKHRLQTC